MKGWNRFGGWRIGIRDINNNYHYFAHLNGFAKDLHVGQIVEPGTHWQCGPQVMGHLGLPENSHLICIMECTRTMDEPNGHLTRLHILNYGKDKKDKKLKNHLHLMGGLNFV